ncbi:MAG: hypothetical protein K6E26_04175 [Clostridiales bacterium]|nr:hypothetical protein [Clostridiales bacterium]
MTSLLSDAKKLDRMLRDAKEQYEAEDRSALKAPVKYRVLWLGFTHVTYGKLDFQMTDFDREYLQAVTLNYTKFLEKISDHNLKITVDLHFVEDAAELRKSDREDWLYLPQESAQPAIEMYLPDKEYDTVLTTIQTEGEENCRRNRLRRGFNKHKAILGLMTAGLSSPIGYSTFNLGFPRRGTYPLSDPVVPSLYATALAVHEWMHQLEYLGELLGIEYPSTHAYRGPSEFPGYKKFTADANDYDYFEFYKLVLSGRLPYTGDGTTKYVGMYPKMWPLIKRNLYEIGSVTLKNADGEEYLAAIPQKTGGKKKPKDRTLRLTLSDKPCVWNLRYSGDDRYVISPKDYPDQRIDLHNAWDEEDNLIKLHGGTGCHKAQIWGLVRSGDGNHFIQTSYESGRVLTVEKKGGTATLCTMGSHGAQRWIIRPVSTPE